MHRLLLILSLFFFITSTAQDLTGTWEGKGAGLSYAKMCIIRQGNTYIGYTYDVGMGHCKANLIATYDSATKKFKGVNDGMIEKTFLHTQSRYKLNYVTIDGKELLQGTVMGKAGFGIGMAFSYTRVSNSIDTTIYMQAWMAKNFSAMPLGDTTIMRDSVVINVPKSGIASLPIKTIADSILINKNNRITDTISVINTSETELLIKVMDNGVVDGDIVSIIHNGKVVAEKISVKEAPYELKIPIGPGNEQQEIVLVADNVGTIPPNTALIVIETPSKQYRLTASTDLSKNAMIIFRYK